MSWIAVAIIGGAVIGAVGTGMAAETSADAAAQAGQQQLALGREQLEATRPLRELSLEQAQFQFEQQKMLSPQFTQAALGALPLLMEDINREAGTGQPFQQRLARGTSNIFSSLAPFGLTDSSVAGKAVGELGTGLLSQDIENLQNQRFRLAGFAPQTPSFFGGATAGLGTSAQLQQGGIMSGLQAGQTTAAGQLGMTSTLSQLPLLLAFQGSGGGGGGGGLPAGSFQSPASGGSAFA